MDAVPTSLDLGAKIALAALRPEERDEVVATLGRLATERSGVRGSPIVGKLGASPGLHVLRVGKRLRVLVSLEPGHITVRDIVSRATVDEFRPTRGRT